MVLDQFPTIGTRSTAASVRGVMPDMTHHSHPEVLVRSTGRTRSSGLGRAAFLLCAVAALTACAPSARDATPMPGVSGSVSPTTAAVTPAPGTPPAASASSQRLTTLVTVQRTGGIAGLNDLIELDSTGSWTHTARGDQRRAGQLSAAQLDRLRTLAADPRLAAEAVRPSDQPGCADGFSYLIIAKGTQVRYSDCAAGGMPVAANEIFTFVTQAVGA